MISDFDKVLDHRGMSSLKWEFIARNGEPEPWDQTDPELENEQVLSMWVADMDFRTAEPVIKALRDRVDRGIYGYAAKTPEYLDAVKGWMKRRHDWNIEVEWILPTVGIVPALNMIVRQFSEPGEKVLIQRPVYHPFTNSIRNNNRMVLCNPLTLKDNRYFMDFEDLELKARDQEVKLMIMSNPHNPVGRAWSSEELQRVGEICLRNNVLLVSDEVHGDLIMPGHRFAPYGLQESRLAENCIVCTAPSKSFNLAGLKASNLLISNPEIRERMQMEIKASGLYGMNPLGIVATQAAYNHGEPWLEEAISYIAKNFEFLEYFIRKHIPSLKVLPLEATYLSWIDCRELDLTQDGLDRLVMEEAHIYVDEGYLFGPEGSGFIRLNLACPRSIVEKALQRLKASIDNLDAGRA